MLTTENKEEISELVDKRIQDKVAHSEPSSETKAFMKKNTNGGKYVKWGIFMTLLTASFAFTILVGGFLWNRTETLEVQLDTYRDSIFDKVSNIETAVGKIEVHIDNINKTLSNAEITQ